ncbi:uncharacterized protein LOC135150432 [Daucus carota subsp. sativus]|uniref:uncharacterized protein LOC135150432 n=1 Tax=Daucus carota subsp. sativus TaxID=79200 RepID=UPI003083146C
MDLDLIFDAAMAGGAHATAELEMEADKLFKYKETVGKTILHLESEKGNIERVRFILREFANKNLLAKLSEFKRTALHLAIYKGRIEVAEVLIDAARQLPPLSDDDDDHPVTSFQDFLRQADHKKNTALHAALKKGHVPIVKLLVEADPTDTHIQNDEGKTPMYIAVEEGFNDIAEIISTTCTAPSFLGPDSSTVVRIKDMEQAKSPGGSLYKIMDKDALYAAAIARDVVAIAALGMHADKVSGYWEETILHTESGNVNTERVRFILTEFADKNLLVKLNKFKQTALHLASAHLHKEVAEVLINAARHLPPSQDYNPFTSFQAFLRHGDEKMNTSLHAAVMQNEEEIVKLLVEADPSDTHTQNNEGKTPMYIAVDRGFNGIAEIISTTCTAPSLDGPDGSTVVRINNLEQGKSPGGTLFKIMDRYAVFVAAIAGDADAIAKLETEVDILNEGEETILHVESQKGYTERVRFILMEFAKKYLLSTLDSHEHTSLHLAANNGHTEVAEIVIDVARQFYTSLDHDNGHIQENPCTSFQAFLSQSDKYIGDSALHAAVKKGHVPIVKLLVEADPSDSHIHIVKLNKYKQTALHLASSEGHTEVAEIIINAARDLLPTDHENAVTTDDDNAVTSFQAFLSQADSNMETALHKVVKKDNGALVKLLVEADPSESHIHIVKLNRYNQTALHLASSEGHTKVAEIIINAARDFLPTDHENAVTADDDNAITPFQSFLRQADSDMETALHEAVRKDNVALVKLLVEADPSDSHIQNRYGETPMYIAVARGYNDIVEIISTTCTAPSLIGPYGRAVLPIKNLDQGMPIRLFSLNVLLIFYLS